jgi:hypothetical protein
MSDRDQQLATDAATILAGSRRFFTDTIDAARKLTAAGAQPELPPHLAASSGTTEPVVVKDNTASPYADLTMKQLVVKALDEHFQHGATTRQLLDFFRDAWDRNIERTNLSPQLSRLYQELRIGRIRSTKGWFLIPQVEHGERWPYRNTRTGEINWKLPSQAHEEDEGLVTRGMHTDDPPDDD